ncbi:hypothetical protein O3P69_008111 [Scylla paramamosain]|uniref:Uncharacterized protein n=1 Tax=Scylla paramamosain TaxID=85552 RepID=A0AAW0T0I9_SCYPA
MSNISFLFPPPPRNELHRDPGWGRDREATGGSGGEVCGREEMRHERGGSVRLRRHTVKERRARVSERE